VLQARAEGFDYGNVVTSHRRAPDGSELSWRMTTYPHDGAVAVLPFLIDWGKQRHPAQTASSGLRLAEFRILAPNPEQVLGQLHATGIDLSVEHAGRPALHAILTGPQDSRLVLAS
jgi:glyoxalase-like protein